MAAADTYCTAVALTELPAELVSFRWHQPSLSPHKNVNSANSPVLPAVQFSGNNAISATNAVTTATSITYSASGKLWRFGDLARIKTGTTRIFGWRKTDDGFEILDEVCQIKIAEA